MKFTDNFKSSVRTAMVGKTVADVEFFDAFGKAEMRVVYSDRTSTTFSFSDNCQVTELNPPRRSEDS